MAKQNEGPPKKYEKTFKQCKSNEEREALVRQAMLDGHSNKSAAKALGLGKRFGIIAGIRRTNKIPSRHRPTHGKAIEASPPPPPAPKPEAAPKHDYGPPKLAGGNWMNQCVAHVDDHQCGNLKVEGEDYCPTHMHLKYKK